MVRTVSRESFNASGIFVRSEEILGYLLVISVVIAVISRFIPFHKTIRVTFKKTGDDMV